MEKLLLEEGEVVSCLGAERLRVEMWLGCCFRLVLVGWTWCSVKGIEPVMSLQETVDLIEKGDIERFDLTK